MDNSSTEIFTAVSDIIVEILDVGPEEVAPEAYLIRDLEVESIDLMEMAVNLNERFKMQVDEELIFLRSLRPVMERARTAGSDTKTALSETFYFLTPERIDEIMEDFENGPVLKVKDLIQYIHHHYTEDSVHAH